MSNHYRAIDWNRQKRRYDLVLAALVILSAVVFLGLSAWVSPESTAETLILRTTSITSFFLLHVVLAIGPLARLDNRFLPLLYNRRHLGVTIFFLALIHGVLAVFQFHALGDENPLVSLFTAYGRDYSVLQNGRIQIAHFPFEPFGVFALMCLLLLAVTSHDFWLRQLGSGLWKTLHLLVYPAYLALVAHVSLGILQTERSPVLPVFLGIGFFSIVVLHLLAARQEARRLRVSQSLASDGFIQVGTTEGLEEGRTRVVLVGTERLALVRHLNRIYATSNRCRHQGGPLGEGRVVDGCLTCPWHGWNYQPHDGCSPPPFEEIIHTYRVRLEGTKIWVHPVALPLRTSTEGALISAIQSYKNP